MPTNWIDFPATQNTRIRAVQVNQLHDVIDSYRADAVLPEIDWIDGRQFSDQTKVRAEQFIQMRTALQDLWSYRRRETIPSWTAGSPPSDDRVVVPSDIDDLRRWTDQVAPTIIPQGVTSFTYEPNTGPANVTSSWVSDITNIGTATTGRLRVRAKILASNLPQNEIDYSEQEAAINRYKNAQHSVNAIFNWEFYRGDYSQPIAPGQTWRNNYIDQFSDRARDFVNAMKNRGTPVQSAIIWNEPNNSGEAPLSHEVFAGLLHECYRKIKAVSNATEVISGGILWPFVPEITPEDATNQVVEWVIPIPRSRAVFDEAAAPGGEPKLRLGQQRLVLHQCTIT